MFGKKKEKELPGDAFIKRLVKPHKKVSREVKEKDIPRLMSEAHIAYNLCHIFLGMYILEGNNSHFAVAHPQIDDKDPLRFWVTKDKKIVINPFITRHTKTTVDGREGCLSSPFSPPTAVQRWHKCEVKYQTLTSDGKLSDVIEMSLSGIDAKVFQHEFDHLESKYIYPIDTEIKKENDINYVKT